MQSQKQQIEAPQSHRHGGFGIIKTIHYLLAACLVVLLLTVEFSLQTSIIWTRSFAMTPWLYKIGAFSVADVVIISVTVFTALLLLKRGLIQQSYYSRVCTLAWGYLAIGVIYNLFVFRLWKTFLYDLKVVLYLTVPYLFLKTVNTKRLLGWFTPPRLFFYVALATLGDFIIVHSWGKSEYPSWLGLPSILPLVPLSLLVVGVMFAPGHRWRLIFAFLMTFEVVSAFNRLSLGMLFAAAIAMGVAWILSVGKKLSYPLQVGAILFWIVAVQGVYLFLLTNPFQWPWLIAKSEGALTRQIQMENAFLNFNRNIPGIIGKGLGSTWFEIVPLEQHDIYAVGTSVAKTSEEAMSMPVKFIFNIPAAAILHKWGILGTVALISLIVLYYKKLYRWIKRLSGNVLDPSEARWLYFYLLVSTVFIIENFTYIGILKTSLMTSLLAFYVEHNIQTSRASLKSAQHYVR